MPNEHDLSARVNDSTSFARGGRRAGTATDSVTAPGTVTDLAVTDTGSNSVTLTFTQVTDGTGNPAQYDVRYAVAPIRWGSAASVANGTCSTPVAGTAIGAKLSCTVLGLSPSTAYNFQLVAFRDTLNVNAKFGGLSNVAATTTRATTPPPGTVTDLSASATSSNSVTLTFTQVTDGTGQPAQYDVRYAVAPIAWGSAASVTSGTCATPVAGTAIGAKITCTVLGLSASTNYNFQLVAFRGTLNVSAKFGGLSNVVSAATPATAPPGAVTDLSATVTGPKSVSLSFTQVTDGTGQPAHYDVRYAVAPITWASATSVTNGTCSTPVAGTAIGAKLTCTVLGLSASTSYNFQLVAFRGTLNAGATLGGLSNVTAATTPAMSPTQLAIVTQPSSSAQSGVPFAQQPTIQLRDSSNQAVNQSGVAVTSAIATGSGGTLTGTTTATTNANGVASFSNLAISGSGTYTLAFTAPGLQSATSSPVTVSAASSGNSGEPAYNPLTDRLILTDNFDSYTGILSGSASFVSRYPSYRALDRTGTGGALVPLSTYVSLVPGRGGSGQAIRLVYGNPSVSGSTTTAQGASDIIVGPEGRLGSVGAWNGTLPQQAAPYVHFMFTTWFRTSVGANPAPFEGNGDSGVKGFMFWHDGNQRYEHSPHRLRDYNGGRYSEARLDAGPPHPPNSVTGLNHYKTADGNPPLWSLYNDGNWHRITVELMPRDNQVTPNLFYGHQGERIWLDGTLVFDNVDNLGFNGNVTRISGCPPWGGDYCYTAGVTHWMVFGNYVNATTANNAPAWFVDFDDWIAWTN